jgi:hypothetical protein
MELVYDTIRIGQTHGRELRMLEAANVRKMRHLSVETAAAEQPEGAIRRSDVDHVKRRRNCSAPDTGVIGHQRSFGYPQI